jgi:hypothetical protein
MTEFMQLKYENNTGVQSINNVYTIVNKVENVLVKTYIFDLIDIGVYVVYALYSRIEYDNPINIVLLSHKYAIMQHKYFPQETIDFRG